MFLYVHILSSSLAEEFFFSLFFICMPYQVPIIAGWTCMHEGNFNDIVKAQELLKFVRIYKRMIFWSQELFFTE